MPSHTPLQSDPCRVAVIQDGARGHYGAALALQQTGLLDTLFTDWFVTDGSMQDYVSRAVSRLGFSVGARMAGRRCDTLDSRRVAQNPAVMLRQQLARLRKKPSHAYYAHCSQIVARWVLRHGWGDANAVFGYVRNMSPTLIADARRRGLLVVADQFIAPAREELTEALIQTERWPDWQQSLAPSGDLLAVDRLERLSWDQASHLTCPSEYVRDGLIRQGVAPDKITVIPYPIDEEAFPFIDRRGRTGPITIGFVGSVNLRKGIPYFFEVARRFDPAKVKFVMVGPIQANPAMIDAHKGPTEVVGRIPRTQMPDWIRRFDILFFPTTCEGSAYALMEAMATGLPVVTSPNSGTVARHGQEGFIAHYDQIDEFTGYITRLADDPDLRWRMGEAARRRYENFNLNWYATQLAELFTSLTSRPSLQKASA